MSINWEDLVLTRAFNGKDAIPRSQFFIKLGGMFYRPRNELSMIINALERKGLIEKFRLGNGDFFYKRKFVGEPIFFKKLTNQN